MYGRGSLKESSVERDVYRKAECVKVYTVFEDREVPRYEGTLFVSTQWARVCMHPQKQVLVVMFMSERHLATETSSPAFTAEREAWMSTLQFTRLD